MTTTTLPNLKLVGSSSSNGGRFHEIRITGETVLIGDVTTDLLKCTGQVEVKGNLSARRLKLTGECKVLGRAQAEHLRAVGAVDVVALNGGQVKISGHLQAETSCEAESLHLLGWVEVGELISAEKLVMELHGPCRAGEIGGGSITVKRNSFSILKSFMTIKEAGTLQAELIEGDAVSLEHVTAAVVRGTRVSLGPGCKIGRVEYRESLEQHPKAEVVVSARI